jgi:hypothetical protein
MVNQGADWLPSLLSEPLGATYRIRPSTAESSKAGWVAAGVASTNRLQASKKIVQTRRRPLRNGRLLSYTIVVIITLLTSSVRGDSHFKINIVAKPPTEKVTVTYINLILE